MKDLRGYSGEKRVNILRPKGKDPFVTQKKEVFSQFKCCSFGSIVALISEFHCQLNSFALITFGFDLLISVLNF